jgi:polyadenylate-binding protein 2
MLSDDKIRSYTLILRNLDDTVTHFDITSHFKTCGHVVGINLLVNRNKNKYAFVSFSTMSSIKLGLLLNGSVLKGKKILVNVKKEFKN